MAANNNRGFRKIIKKLTSDQIEILEIHLNTFFTDYSKYLDKIFTGLPSKEKYQHGLNYFFIQ